jgi:UDP-2,3-diacylglucosamine hydrolase
LHTAEALVLKGDTFDFRWSTLGRHDETLPAAMDWLRNVARDFPRCRIHLIVGNHDCTAAFLVELNRLTGEVARFQWHEYSLRLGQALFIHGDCAHRQMDHHGLRRFRRKWHGDWRCGAALSAAYVCADRLGITRRVHEWHFPRAKTVERIVHYLDRTQPGLREQIRDCYFGHTHLPFANYEHAGILFHNTGSAILNLDFNPLRFETPAEQAGAQMPHRS